jgi:hypothetical protein
MRLPRSAVLNRAILRPAVAVLLGTLTFWVGLVHLVRISTRVTTRVFFGEAPAQVVAMLEEERRADRGRSPGDSATPSASDANSTVGPR